MTSPNLHIEWYREHLDGRGLALIAIAILQCPVFLILAQIREDRQDDLESLDRTLLKFFSEPSDSSCKSVATLLGLNEGLIVSRVKFLEAISYLEHNAKDSYIVTAEGRAVAQDEGKKISHVRSELFLVNGTNFCPLPRHFYQNRSQWEISRREFYAFAPDIIPEPPTKAIVDALLAVPMDKRDTHRIPQGLMEVVALECHPVTFPIGIGFAVDAKGHVVKEIVDCTSHIPNENSKQALSFLASNIIDRIPSLSIQVRLSRNETMAHFCHNWRYLGDNDREAENRHLIFNRPKQEIVQEILYQQYRIRIKDPRCLTIELSKITLVVDESLLMQEDVDKRRVVAALERRRDYFKQKPTTGIFIVFFDVLPGDDFVFQLLEIFAQINQTGFEFNNLFQQFKGRYTELRKCLRALDQIDLLLELDMKYCLGYFHKKKWHPPPGNPEAT